MRVTLSIPTLEIALTELREIRKELSKMAISQAQFDVDLKALTDAITALIAAVEALPKGDLSAEDQSVIDAAAAVQAELNKIVPPPVP